MRGLAVERSKIDHADEWRRYYENIAGDDAKFSLFKMLKDRRDNKHDSDAAKVLDELVGRWLKEKAR